jgi:hypothetical protein
LTSVTISDAEVPLWCTAFVTCFVRQLHQSQFLIQSFHDLLLCYRKHFVWTINFTNYLRHPSR